MEKEKRENCDNGMKKLDTNPNVALFPFFFFSRDCCGVSVHLLKWLFSFQDEACSGFASFSDATSTRKSAISFFRVAFSPLNFFAHNRTHAPRQHTLSSLLPVCVSNNGSSSSSFSLVATLCTETSKETHPKASQRKAKRTKRE